MQMLALLPSDLKSDLKQNASLHVQVNTVFFFNLVLCIINDHLRRDMCD